MIRKAWFSSLLVWVSLGLLLQAQTCERGDTFLLSLSLVVDGEEQIQGFNINNRTGYSVTTTGTTGTLTVETRMEDSNATYQWIVGGTTIEANTIGVGGGTVEVTIPEGQSQLFIGVRAAEGNVDGYWVDVEREAPPACDGDVTRVSVDVSGVQGNNLSFRPSLSADGRLVTFTSRATNLVPGDTNGTDDVFVHDLQTGTTTRVSVDSVGAQASGGSTRPSITADGRWIAFDSGANNLVPGDTNATVDIFVHDLQTGATTRVSVDDAGAEGSGASVEPSISADGSVVAFRSRATDLVSGDTNATDDIFVHDLQTGATTRVSVDDAGAEGNGISIEPSISADGRFVAFHSAADNLVPVDTNGFVDTFVHDLQTGATTRVSVDDAGAEGNGDSFEPSISADGRLVAFTSRAPNLVPGDTNATVDIFVHDLQTGATTRVSVDSAGAEANNFSSQPSISADGSVVAFRSSATNLVPGDTNATDDIFVHDLQTGATTRVSVDDAGAEGSGSSVEPSISADGSVVAFRSSATNLVPGDTNGQPDVFVTCVSFE